MKIEVADIFAFIVIVVLELTLMFWGYHAGRPEVLENGCIVHDDNIYCMEGVAE